MARYDHLATRPARSVRDILRWNFERLTGKAPRDSEPDFRPPARENDGRAVRELPSSLTWIGHSTFVARLGGRFVVTDPVWSNRLSGVLPRRGSPGVALDALPAPEVVLLTHNHRDHFDRPTLRRLGAGPLYVAPAGNRALLQSAGAGRVVELDWWQSHREGDLEITVVPARHWSMHSPWNRNEMLWGGFVARGPEGAIWFCGDTGFFEGAAEIGARLGPIDWAIIPIGAYAPRWFMEPQHCTPEEAGRLFELSGARTFVASHWGTFKLSDEPLAEPPERLRAWWTETNKDPERLWILDVGETRALAAAERR
jgi:L-ascorbate metabolism protein UlaG (beta-lactamase superfamily)